MRKFHLRYFRLGLYSQSPRCATTWSTQECHEGTARACFSAGRHRGKEISSASRGRAAWASARRHASGALPVLRSRRWRLVTALRYSHRLFRGRSLLSGFRPSVWHWIRSPIRSLGKSSWVRNDALAPAWRPDALCRLSHRTHWISRTRELRILGTGTAGNASLVESVSNRRRAALRFRSPSSPVRYLAMGAPPSDPRAVQCPGQRRVAL